MDAPLEELPRGCWTRPADTAQQAPHKRHNVLQRPMDMVCSPHDTQMCCVCRAVPSCLKELLLQTSLRRAAAPPHLRTRAMAQHDGQHAVRLVQLRDSHQGAERAVASRRRWILRQQERRSATMHKLFGVTFAMNQTQEQTHGDLDGIKVAELATQKSHSTCI
jgi:hypothetical protein